MYWLSEFGDSDELPEDFEESDDYVAVPHKNELDLGVRLVEAFVAERTPDDFDDVRDMFRRRGGYRRYRDFLDSRNLQSEWDAFEETQTREALLAWCEGDGIEVITE